MNSRCCLGVPQFGRAQLYTQSCAEPMVASVREETYWHEV